MKDKIFNTRSVRDIHGVRYTGRSIRQIDAAIQKLFEGYTVKAEQHCDNSTYGYDLTLYMRIIQRWVNEHGCVRDLHTNKKNLTIRIKDSYIRSIQERRETMLKYKEQI